MMRHLTDEEIVAALERLTADQPEITEVYTIDEVAAELGIDLDS